MGSSSTRHSANIRDRMGAVALKCFKAERANRLVDARALLRGAVVVEEVDHLVGGEVVSGAHSTSPPDPLPTALWTEVKPPAWSIPPPIADARFAAGGAS